MSSWYPLVKWLHIVSSTVLFGTGAGIAFFFLRAQWSGDSRIIAAVGRDVVLADMVFTATAVVLQPVTGIALALMARYPLSTPWLVWSIVLYGLVGCCWLPVVWLQMRMRDLAVDAAHRGQPLPVQYEIYCRRWFVLGWPAFIGVLIIFYLMVARPRISYTTLGDRLVVSAWGRNITNKQYLVAAYDLSAFGFDQWVIGDPRTFGVTVRYLTR